MEQREKIKEEQENKLRKIVEYVYERVPFYKKKFDEKGITPRDIRTIDDLKKLPFTTKQDLRDNYPYKMFATLLENIVRIHASSGTTGLQTIVGYTKNDIEIWSTMVAKTLKRYGVTSKDIVQVAYGYGMFTGGLGIHYGIEKLGAAVVPISGGNTEKQVLTMKNFGVTVLACTPSYALHIYDTMKAMGISKDELKLRIGIFGAEPWSDELRNQIQDKFGIKAYDIYGLSEVMGPGIGGECECQNGLHIDEENFIAEIIDPETLENVRDGEEGELVFTTLTKEGIPLIRYRTRDITTLTHEKCRCGSEEARIKRICGRSDDMLIIRGVNVYPSQIENVLFTFDDISHNYLIVVDKSDVLDRLIINIELTEPKENFDSKYLENLSKSINKELNSMIQISCKINLVDPNTIDKSYGKAKRVISK